MKRFFTGLLVVGLMISLLGVNGFAEEKEKENFRIKLLYQATEAVTGWDAVDGDLWAYRNFEYYFGTWFAYARILEKDHGWLGTYTKLNYKPGDEVSLRQVRGISEDFFEAGFGLEAELRIWKGIWGGISFTPNTVFTVSGVEEDEKMIFEEFVETSVDYNYWGDPYYNYYMKLDRINIIQKTNERIFSRNFKLYIKGEAKIVFFFYSLGVGVDIWRVNQKVSIEKTIYDLMPWTEVLISEREENSEFTNTDWHFRPFLFQTLDLPIVGGLGLGLQMNLAFKKQFNYKNDYFLLPISQDHLERTIKLESMSMMFYLRYGF